MRKVFGLDGGHGTGNTGYGYDPGYVGGGHAEADFSLDVVLALKHMGVHAYGVDPSQIVLLRDEKSDFLPVWKRDDLAVQKGCTHLVSFHWNSAAPGVRGTETFYPKAGNKEDKAFAAAMNRAAVLAGGKFDPAWKDRGIKNELLTHHGSLAVFKSDKQLTCCLVELGFGSNELDRQILLMRSFRIVYAHWFWAKILGVAPKL